MSVWIVCDEGNLQLPLALQPHMKERLQALMAGAFTSPPSIDPAVLAHQLAETIEASLERGALPPTDKQLNYAVAIARGLGIELPAQALQDRHVMHAFIAANSGPFHSKRRSLFRGGI